MAYNHFITITDLGQTTAWELLLHAKKIKDHKSQNQCMQGKVAALLFEKASTRTRISFEVAVRQLGGNTIFLTPQETQVGRSEPLKDTVRVLSRYVDCIIIRTFEESKLNELVEINTTPIINALTDYGHPCQVMSDLLTIYEQTPNFEDIHIAWIGDGNNVLNSWIEAAMYFPFKLTIATPNGYEPRIEHIEFAKKNKAKILVTNNPLLAVKDVDYIYTDVWTSMGQEKEYKKRMEDFRGFCVDNNLMNQAKPNAKFLHCLPAHRGEEVSDQVIESEKSLVWEQAENRLHMQKALLEWIFQ